MRRPVLNRSPHPWLLCQQPDAFADGLHGPLGGVRALGGKKAIEALHIEQRFRRFVDVVIPLLAAADQGAGYVDMRYSRGFAIAWSPAGEPANNQTTGMNQDV